MIRVTYDPREGEAEVLAVGREPAEYPARRGGWSRLLIVAQAAALLGLIVVALHYRAEASNAHDRKPSHAPPRIPASVPDVSSHAFRLPAEAKITGTVLITDAANQGADRAQFVLSAVISGAQPDTAYFLTGNDCSAALPDHVWAAGFTDASGQAVLTGHAWTGSVADVYWLALTPSPASASPGLRGNFAEGTAEPFPAHQAPCAPAP
jgi:hypothetical protein